MLISHCQKAGQRHSIKILNKSFEDVAKLKYLEETPTDQNCMHKVIKSRLHSVNACYQSIQCLLSPHLLSRNVKVKIYKTITVPVVKPGLSHKRKSTD
jgi:hypothetical protein